MGLIETVILAMIWLVVLAIVVYIVIYVLGQIGVVIPPQIIKLLWLIVMLVALLMLVRLILPATGLRFGEQARNFQTVALPERLHG